MLTKIIILFLIILILFKFLQMHYARKIKISEKYKLVLGVCGGLAEYFNVSVSLMRLGWLLFVLLGGSGILIYLLCYICMGKPRSN